jgi:hypothetical protein
VSGINDKDQRAAAAAALRNFKEASAERRRARIMALPEGGQAVDVTEHVVSLLDMITQSMDWGSDFWTDSDLPSFIELCKLLKFDPPVCAACGQPAEAHT